MKVLLITFPERVDLINFFASDQENDYFLLNYSTNKTSGSNISFLKGSENINDHKFISKWVKKINPDRIVFFESSDIRLVFLNIIFTSLGYKLVFLDHGIREIKSMQFVRSIEKEVMKNNEDHLKVIPKKKTLLLFFETIYHLPRKQFFSLCKILVDFLGHWNKERLFNKLLNLGNSFWRQIIYCTNNLEVISLTVKIEEDKVFYTGFPSSDSYFPLKKNDDSDYIVFIDHPYLETGIYTIEQHRKIVIALKELSLSKEKKIFVKLHPKTIVENWSQYDLGSNLEIVSDFPPPSFYLNASMIISFSSTMLINFLSKKKNVVLLSWYLDESHLGNDFSKLGVCHLSNNLDDLKVKFDYWISHNLAEEDLNNWEMFIKLFNYPFDGKATKRVLEAIHSS